MSRSKPSSGSPPEFFADRCLGKGAPTILVKHGWIVRLIAEHFHDDAQQVSDPEWIEYGLARGWALLTQDERIRRQRAALEPLRRYRGSIFCLTSAQLTVAAKADRLLRLQGAIYDLARHGRGGFFLVDEYRVLRRRA